MKQEIKIHSIVRIEDNDSVEARYGLVEDIKSDIAVVMLLDELDEYKECSLDRLTVMPRKTLPMDKLKDFLQYRINEIVLVEGVEPEDNYDFEEEYNIKLEDMETAVCNMRKALEADPDNAPDILSWAQFLIYELPERAVMCSQSFELNKTEPLTEEDVTSSIYDIFCEFANIWDYSDMLAYEEWGQYGEMPGIALFDRILKDVAAYREGKEIYVWRWTKDRSIQYISKLQEKDLKKMSEEQVAAIRKTAELLWAEGNPEIMEWIGYAYYGGNRIFPCDWEKSRDIFLKLLDTDGIDEQKKCYYANTLGYIYYYGRCSNGVPEYDKAYKYYSIGAAGWIYESMYKLSDMYRHGYGVPKNNLAARNYISFIYEDNLKYIQEGKFDCKFADVALRMGNLCRDEIFHDDEYYYYTLADYAIRKRLPYEHFGDSQVFAGIQRELARIREERPLEDIKPSRDQFLYWIAEALQGSACKIEFKELISGIKITATRLPESGEEEPRKFFLCIPESGYCELTDQVSEVAKDVDIIWTKNGEGEFIADSIAVQAEENENGQSIVFLHHNQAAGCISAKYFVRKISAANMPKQENYNMASVEFTPGGRTYDYLSGDLELEVGDRVVVSAGGEEKEVTVVRTFVMTVSELPVAIEKYKSILRKVDN